MKRANEALGREYWVYVPDNYDPNKSYGLIVWLHAAGQGGKDGENMAKTFRDVCEDHNFILMGPKSGNNDGWVPSETEVVMQDVKTVLGQYTIDRRAWWPTAWASAGRWRSIGFNARDVFRGVGDRRRGAGHQPEGERREPAAVVLHRRRRQGPAHQGHRGEQGPADGEAVPGDVPRDEGERQGVLRRTTFNEFLAWLDSLDRI